MQNYVSCPACAPVREAVAKLQYAGNTSAVALTAQRMGLVWSQPSKAPAFMHSCGSSSFQL